MLIWANKKEINKTIIKPLSKMYAKKLDTWDFSGILKSWELSVILRQIRRHFGYKKSISILDFGTGRSPFPAYLDHSGYKNVTCFDKEDGRYRKVDEKAYNNLYDSSIKYIKSNKIKRSLGKFDVIYSASVLEHISDKKELLRILWLLTRHVTPGGLFIHVVDYKRNATTGKPEGLKNLKKMIDNCGIDISYKREETPGCRQFIGAPKGTWWVDHRDIIMTRIAFFNGK